MPLFFEHKKKNSAKYIVKAYFGKSRINYIDTLMYEERESVILTLVIFLLLFQQKYYLGGITQVATITLETFAGNEGNVASSRVRSCFSATRCTWTTNVTPLTLSWVTILHYCNLRVPS